MSVKSASDSSVSYNPCDLSICIITYRRPELLDRCLASVRVSLDLLSNCYWEVIVSDDCPLKSALPIVENSGLACWVQGPGRGVAANRNHVVSVTNGKWIVFIDDDEVADHNWINSIYNAISSGKWDVIEGRVEPVDYPDSILWYAPCISAGGAYCTANLAINKDYFYMLGCFNENFSVSHEDVEFGRRISSSLPRSLYLNQAIVYHPARSMTFVAVLNRMVNLQCQSYLYQVHEPLKLSLPQFSFLLSFMFKYWFRIVRFELAARTKSQWRRQLQSSVLLLFTTPIAFIKILNMHICSD